MRPLIVTAALLAAGTSAAAAQQPHAAHHATAATAATKATARPAAIAGSARVLTITARDFAFEAPDSVAAGLTTVRLVNRGPELHHVQLMRLDEGKSMQDFFAALKAGGPPPRWAHDVGGPNTPVPGGESAATLDLAPGRYVVTCFIPSPDKVPHVAKGMARELVVTGPRRASAAAATAPAAAGTPTTTLTLDDYSFTFSRPLRAGRQTVRVRNRAAQSHEVLFVQLAPGKTAADLVAWVDDQQGPPPAKPVGGTTGIESRGWNDVPLDLVPGEYALLCFIPDAKDGKPHIAHGMVKQLRVEAPAGRGGAAGGR